jgi:hypothetical protein
VYILAIARAEFKGDRPAKKVDPGAVRRQNTMKTSGPT